MVNNLVINFVERHFENQLLLSNPKRKFKTIKFTKEFFDNYQFITCLKDIIRAIKMIHNEELSLNGSFSLEDVHYEVRNKI